MAAARKKMSGVDNTEVKEEVVDTKVKYRCDFGSYEEYTKYTGKKG